MEIRITREILGSNYTIGDLFVNGRFICNTLEDKVIDINKNGKFDGEEVKVYGESAIPYGEYKVIVNYSPKFKRELPLLLKVPHFEGIRIHRGNFIKDTLGCILVGEHNGGNTIVNSTKNEIKITELIKASITRGEEVIIKIE